MKDNIEVSTINGNFCTEEKSDSCGIVIFGASGDLTSRKLIPALYNLYDRGLLPDDFFVIGAGRSQMTDAEFQNRVKESIARYEPDNETMDEFSGRFYYLFGDYHGDDLYKSILNRILGFRKTVEYTNYIFYLSTPPSLYAPIIEKLDSNSLTKEHISGSSSLRVVIEKPFGYDLEGALKLDEDIHRHLNEDQIYRIDHYLGKETVQNILMFRFANAVFEPIWNRRYIDHVQITAVETIGVEHRAGYYEQAGLLRDMFQNHMLQMLALVAMEPPASFDANRVRDEKVKLLRAVRPFTAETLPEWIVRGQYGEGKTASGEDMPAYRDEKNVAPGSMIETFVAAKFMVDNWRWQGVPFYARSGKCLPKRLSEIAIVFKDIPHSLFSSFPGGVPVSNTLVLNVQPDEGVSLSFQAKGPGSKLCMSTLSMDFRYKDVFGIKPPDAYERLLLDCMLGDQTLFIRHDDMEVAWSLITPVLDAWRDNPESSPLCPYPSGSWGPEESMNIPGRDGRHWRYE